ncbi:MAG: SDR family NAD(P)-dependent oxidoreductase [Calditrichae bacterium]|nr:SDR family NAD(P)-dependent oxidoreductase [Calditrichota bacterium]MCB9090328.1 SDR family NAD(P)-dependent oxidoreductase [Calditrichia bacterium]
MKKAIIIGATSGIGRALAEKLSREGYELGLTGRREALLKDIKESLPTASHICVMDVADTAAARQAFQGLLADMSDVELVILNAGVGSKNQHDWETEKQVIDVNVRGFVAASQVAVDHFKARGGGHLVGISSVAGLIGLGRAGAYSASKAFISTYMQALRQRSIRTGLNITVTDIKPGYVATEMTEGRKGLFWMCSVETAAEQIYQAIIKRKRHAYITRRWRLIGWLIKAMPEWLYLRLPA